MILCEGFLTDFPFTLTRPSLMLDTILPRLISGVFALK